MRSLAVRLLALLAVPLVAVAIASAARWESPSTDYWYWSLTALSVVFVIVVAAIGVTRENKAPRGRVDERAQMQSNEFSALFIGGLINAMSLIMAMRVASVALLISGLAILWTLAWLPRWMRGISVRTSIVIQRETATVFAFVTDLRNDAQYVPELEAVEKITDGSIGVGTRFLSRMRLPNGVFEGVEEITEYQPPNQMASHIVTAMRPNLGVLTFEAIPEGTRLKYRFDTEIVYSSALLNQGLMRWVIQMDLRSRRKAVWGRLKQIMESHAEKV
jgi:carbon monoxide dehydrogenase subunit G